VKNLKKRKSYSAFMLVVAILTTLLLTACGASATNTVVPAPATTAPATTAPTASGTTVATGSIPTSGGFLDTIKQRGKLIVGVKYDQPGFGLNDPISKKLEGFEVDMAREFAKGLLGSADKVEFIESVSANRIPFLQEDKADIVIATFTINNQRKQQIDFSDVYYVAQQKLLVKKGSPIKSVADLAGKNVATVQGSTSEKNLSEKAPQAKPLLFGKYSEAFVALGNGQADAVTTDDVILAGLKLTASNPANYEIVGDGFSSEPYGIGIKKGRTELLTYVNGTLAAMKTDGRWKSLYDKYVKPATGTSAEPPK
jgi:aspartate/glutamate/glutamine transport system substrate-binding protein